MTEPLEPYPERSAMDEARVGMNAGIASIPLLGGPLQILVDGILAPAFDRRRDRWLRVLGEMMIVSPLGSTPWPATRYSSPPWSRRRASL
jgi:hypothetical protein